jgi:hypothetical protein
VNADERRRRRIALIWTAGTAAGVGGLAFFAGVTAPLSLLLGLSIVAAGAVAALLAGPRDEHWPESRVVLRSGARREVARLSWSMVDDDGRVADVAVQRLRAFAAARLAERGIDLDDPAQRQAAESALGAAEYRLLTAPGRHRPETLLRCARAIERLDRREDVPAGGAPASSQPAPRRTA